MNLYDIAAEYRDQARALADLGLDDQTLADTLEGMSGALEAKAQNLVFVVRNLEALAAAAKQAGADMTARAKAVQARADRLQAYLLNAMQIAGVEKIECPQFAIARRKNPPAVDVFDADQLPAQYLRTPPVPAPVPDKSSIGAALKSGADVPGARLVQSERLETK